MKRDPDVIAIIQARMGSKRLPGKVLRPVDGRPLLEREIARIRRAQTLDGIVLATSTSPADDAIERFCKEHGVECFRGSEDDVLSRYYDCARTFDPKTVVRLTADCPLVDPAVIDSVVTRFRLGDFDYLANTIPPELSDYPDGMDVEVFSMDALTRAHREATVRSDREHVTFVMWKNPDRYRIGRHAGAENLSRFRVTVDFPEDFELVSEIFREFDSRGIEPDLAQITSFIDSRPDLRALNAAYRPGLGWKT